MPPRDAEPWESRFAVAFDDSYTPTDVNLQGRAPNDVLDQQLFQARLGHAALVILVRVDQVWGKGRYEGRQDQFVELEVGEVLMGSLPKEAPERLMVEVQSIDELPGALRGEVMLLFLRWDEEFAPPYHHHLMPADEELIALIKAMVEHAQGEGVLNADGGESKKGRRGRKTKAKRGNRRKRRGREGSGPKEPVDDPGVSGGTPIAAPVGTAIPSDTHEAPRDQTGADAPQPDASTGLQDLGEPDPKPDSNQREPGGGNEPPEAN